MTKRAYFCAGSVLAVAVSLGAVQAHAQAAAPPATATAPPPAANATTLSDLVVVAEKREERLETVPVAVSAFSAEQRTLLGIQGFQDLTNFTPGFHYQAASDRPYMRGIGRNTDNLAVASAVAVYYNGVYDGANASILMQHSDLFIDTIEVDRGPQNTLHGANADGGSINYISKKPTKDFYAEGRVGVANNDRYWGEAVVSGPITDWLRFRLGANSTQEHGGFYKNYDGHDQGGSLPQEGGNGESQYLEAQFDANLGEHLDAWAMISSGTFSADYHQSATQGAIPDNFQLNSTYAPSGFFGLCGLPGVASSPGGDAGCSTFPTGVAPQTVIPGSVTGGPVFANAFPGNNPTTRDPRTFIQEMTSTNKLKADIALATNWTYHFPSFDVTYLGGYQKFNYVLNFSTYADAGVTSYQTQGAQNPGLCALDAAGAGYDPALCSQPLTIYPAPNTTYFQERDAFFSHEIDFTSTSSGPLQWLGGLYYYHEGYDQPVWAGVEPAQTQFAHPYYIGANGSLIAAPANPASAASTSDTRLTYDSWAVFGHVDYKFNDQWKAHVGLRYTGDHKFGEQYWRFEEFDVISPFTSGGVPGVLSGFGAATPALDLTSIAAAGALGVSFPGAGPATINPVTGNAERHLDARWDAWTGDAGIDWTPDRDTLVYGKYSRGYKAGGFSTFTISPNPETGLETVDAFEVGLKKTIAHQFQLNGAAFWYDYKNDQIPLDVQNLSTGQIASQLFNLKSVHIWGVELEGVWRPTDALQVTAEYAHLEATVANPGGCFEDVIDPTASVPGANTSGCTPASVSPTGALVPATQNLKGQTLPESPPNKVTLSAVYTWTFDPGKLSLSGTYIWKDKTYGGLFNRPYDLAPALNQFNLRAVWTGANDRYNIILYCDNVFDKTNFDARSGTLVVAPTALGQVGTIVTNSYMELPRTFGMELRYRFH